jgi:hypothetical protein
MPRSLVVLVTLAAVALGAAAPAQASQFARYGIQDDGWLFYGAGTLEERLDRLAALGVDLVRVTVRWDQVARTRPVRPRDPGSPGYVWGTHDQVLEGLRHRRIATVVTLLGTPRWANGNQAWQVAPTRGPDFGDFAFAAARRYWWVRDWTIWNEPNQRRWLRPTTPAVYTQRLLNPGYRQLKLANRANRIGGGVTAPRGNVGGMSPVAWIRGMRASGALLDAYAHHPYPLRPRQETPWTGGCAHCETITMADLERLIREVRRNFGNKRIWLTEYGYQTNPPDRGLGVAPALAARYVGESAHRVYAAPYVDMLIHFMVRDDTALGGWQSGLFTSGGSAKPTYTAFRFPLAQVSRTGARTVLWGQVRPGPNGRKQYRLRAVRGGRWVWVGGMRTTDARGVFRLTVNANRGARFQVFVPAEPAYGPILTVR